ncbi:acetoacetate decarboxylase family protein [Streptomyces sp. NBC_00335]|uniref:acetoacetate decarboxylase family protein n=1 Tax=unclassified Streptomyces TaxID=2593676 RepID=UPI0022504F60|nr:MULTISPECIES: acetoacetate decarboxylase family protein [unclassified Streptomyces]MCX5410235.1 acetoacetate decarboxylase family protein [Streptomyces sp. NBC_00086]
MPTYPPEPWHLAGQMHLSLWLVPRRSLPPLPYGVRPVTLAGRALMGAAWVVYENDSVLHYNELLSAVLVRDGLRPRVTITDIWVDSPPSMAGGRELWGIPKELADFDLIRGEGRGGIEATARTGGATLCSASFRPATRLPGRWPVSYRLAQQLDGRLKTSRVRSRSAVGLARATWRIPPRGTLRLPVDGPPLFSLTLHDFGLTFGSAARETSTPKA